MSSVAAAEAQTRSGLHRRDPRARRRARRARTRTLPAIRIASASLSVAIGRVLELSDGRARSPAPRRAAPRHRQDRRARRRAAEAGRADRRRSSTSSSSIRCSARASSRSVPFLAPHIPIVELHSRAARRPRLSARTARRRHPARRAHRPRGRRLRRDHRAPAPTARARPPGDALRELWRCAGTGFHARDRALANALPGVTTEAGDAMLQTPDQQTTARAGLFGPASAAGRAEHPRATIPVAQAFRALP